MEKNKKKNTKRNKKEKRLNYSSQMSLFNNKI